MPISPGAPSTTIGGLVQDVTDALQGRTDLSTTFVCHYLKKALSEITESYPFEELRTTGPTVPLLTNAVTFSGVVNNAVYPISYFLNTNDDLTMLEAGAIYVDFPNNTVVAPLSYKTPLSIEPMIAPATVGLPARWTRYGVNVHLGPTPNQAYSVYFRYQMRHPFPDSDSSLSTAQAYIPTSWQDIIAYAAAERIAIVKRWTDQVKFLHDILYGDPEYATSGGKRGRPGLIAARLFQQERDEMYTSRQLMPLVPRYNAR